MAHLLRTPVKASGSRPERGVVATGRDFAQGLLASLIHTQFEAIHFSRIAYAYGHPEIFCLLGQGLAQLSVMPCLTLANWLPLAEFHFPHL